MKRKNTKTVMAAFALTSLSLITLSACGNTNPTPSPSTHKQEIEVKETEEAGKEPTSVVGEGIGDNIFEASEQADIDTTDCFIVFLVASRQMIANDLKYEKSSVDTSELDDFEMGEWVRTTSFDMCHYRWHQLGTTSPKNWYAIKPIVDDYEIALDVSPNIIQSVTYNGVEYKTRDYGDYDETYGGHFVLTPDGVEFRKPDAEKAWENQDEDFANNLSFDDYIVVAVKETGDRPFEENFDVIDEKAGTDFNSSDLDCFLLGQWWHTRSFSICRFGYEKTANGVYSYYTIMPSVNNLAEIQMNVTIYSKGAEEIFFYGKNNCHTVYDYDPCVKSDNDFRKDRSGWFTVSVFDGVGYQKDTYDKAMYD